MDTPGGPFSLAAVALPDCIRNRALHSHDFKNPFRCTKRFPTSHLLDSPPGWEEGIITAPALHSLQL